MAKFRRISRTFRSDDGWEEMDRRAARALRVRAAFARCAAFAAAALLLYCLVSFVAARAGARRYDAWGAACSACAGKGGADGD